MLNPLAVDEAILIETHNPSWGCLTWVDVTKSIEFIILITPHGDA